MTSEWRRVSRGASCGAILDIRALARRHDDYALLARSRARAAAALTRPRSTLRCGQRRAVRAPVGGRTVGCLPVGRVLGGAISVAGCIAGHRAVRGHVVGRGTRCAARRAVYKGVEMVSREKRFGGDTSTSRALALWLSAGGAPYTPD